MKFTDGNWMLQEGVSAHYAQQVYETTTTHDAVEFLVPCNRVNTRGDTLSGPALTVKISSPIEDVIAVRVDHFKGGVEKGPQFQILNENPSISIEETAERISITSGRLTANVARNQWAIDFQGDGTHLTRTPEKGTAHMKVADKGNFIMSQLMLGVGECVYGLGERFTNFIKNGQSIDIWNRDGGTNSEQAYKNIPFYLTNRGYGVFVRHSGAVDFEVGTERSSRVQFSVKGEWIEYYIIYGPTPKEILEKYTRLTGRPALPPAWSFGLWLSTSFLTNYDESTVTEFTNGMSERDIPLSVFHYDCFWMKDFHWCDFEWDARVFPDPAGMLRRLKEKGLRISVWVNPYIAQASKLFAEGMEHGYLLKRADGSVWQTELWQPGMAIVDFTNPAAKAWYQAQIKGLLDIGVDSIKTDFGERIPTDVVYFDGSDPERMHNYYTFLYNQATFDIIEQERGKGNAVLFARSATAGGQLFPVHWGGDCWSDYDAMAESLRGGLSLGLSGFGFWSHDIGGFEGKPSIDLYLRWVAFGLLSSHSRLHGSHSYRVPWQYEEPIAVEVLRKFSKLKNQMMPYLWNAAWQAHEVGTPVLRAMLLEFPEDPTCHFLDRQYMLGDSLLVAPIFQEDGVVEYYLPAGTWHHVLRGTTYEGGRWITETYALDELPLLLREGHALPLGQDDRPDYDYLADLTVLAPSGKRTTTVRNATGTMISFEINDGTLASGSAKIVQNLGE